MLRLSSADAAVPAAPSAGLPATGGPDALARALGQAWAAGRQRRLPGRLRRPLAVPDDAVALALLPARELTRSMGVFSSAGLAAERGYAVPLVVAVVESTTDPLPSGWVRRVLENSPGPAYRVSQEDDDLDADARAVQALARREGRPVVWHVHADLDDVRAALERPQPARSAAPDAAAEAPETPEALEAERRRVFGGALPEDGDPLTFAETMDRAVLDEGVVRPRLVVLTADAEAMTSLARRRLGSSRVLEVPVDGASLLGFARGAAESGLLPLVKVTTVETLLGAVAGLVTGAAAVVRAALPPGSDVEVIAAVSALARTRGAVVACPSHPSDVAGTLHHCLDRAAAGHPVLIVEPFDPERRDLLTPGDGAWLAGYSRGGSGGSFTPGRAAVWGTGPDVTLAALGSGVPLAVRTASTLQTEGIDCRVLDLRWRRPTPVDDVLREAEATGALVVIEHGPESAGLSEELVTASLEAGFGGRLVRVTPTLGDGGVRTPVTPEALESAVRALLQSEI